MKSLEGRKIRYFTHMRGSQRYWLAAVACACSLAAVPSKPADEPAAASVQPAVASRQQSALEHRVTLLSAELGLDTQQQAQVRRILDDQRRQVMRVWNDSSVPAAYRVSATRAISDRTGDRIRALLSDEQRAKYNKPRKPPEVTAGSATPSVEDWMKATSPK